MMITAKQAHRVARQLFRLCLVNGSLDDRRARLVVQRGVEAHSRGHLAILSRLQRLVKLDRASHSATVESAAPLPPDLRRRIEERLTRLYGTGITTSFIENPSLIGGVSVQVGSDVYDGSVAGGLAALEARF